MGDPIKHECGIALIRLKKPLEYYAQKYGTALYGFNKLFLLMEKQHNRGQDGAGIGCVKLNPELGQAFMFRDRSLEANALNDLFKDQLKIFDKMVRAKLIESQTDTASIKKNFDYGGEVLLGHLRYGTSGSFSQRSCHPYLRRSNWTTRNLMVCGNFNMTNTAELNDTLIQRGQHPIFDTDTQTILEEIGFWLDQEHDRLYRAYRDIGLQGGEIPLRIAEKLDLAEVLRQSAKVWDGGYTIAGLIGTGDAFVLRDPNGIRPAHYFEDDEFIAVASERVPLLTVFNLNLGDVRELPPGQGLIIRANGKLTQHTILPASPKRTSCSFERIYFSRGNDPDIYQERQALGGAMAPQILESIKGNLADTVFSYIPNTAETAYYGLLRALREYRRNEVKKAILDAQKNGPLSDELLDQLILQNWPRGEKIALKDQKLRTFISQEKGRSKLVSHIYDITYGVVAEKDTLVVMDDSIVRGTTLRDSTLKILSRTNPRKIIIASTAPQIRYPDCYGIDMSELGKFIAFQAAIALLKDTGREQLIKDVYEKCCVEVKKHRSEQVNQVRAIYDPFTPEQISRKISELVYPKDIEWKGEVEIIFQTIENLHNAIPDHSGDWYFTGHYPTPGGTAVCNKAFIQFFEQRTGRGYE